MEIHPAMYYKHTNPQLRELKSKRLKVCFVHLVILKEKSEAYLDLIRTVGGTNALFASPIKIICVDVLLKCH